MKGYTPVDCEKLEALIKKEGKDRLSFSRQCGHERGWINNILNTSHKMANSDILLIKTMFGVDVTLKEQPKETPIPEEAEVIKRLDILIQTTYQILDELRNCHE